MGIDRNLHKPWLDGPGIGLIPYGTIDDVGIEDTYQAGHGPF